MRAIALWIGLALVVGTCSYNAYQSSQSRKERQEQAAIAKAEREAEFGRWIAEFGADDKWLRSLSKGESFRLEPVLTIELEERWLKGKPIVFLGTLEDIETEDERNYRVTILRTGLDPLLGTTLQLSLVADQVLISDFLKKHPDLFDEFGFNNGVAVIATIEEIRSTYAVVEDEKEAIRIGFGHLVDLRFTGDPFL